MDVPFSYKYLVSASGTPAYKVRSKNSMKSQTGINSCLDKRKAELNMTATLELNVFEILPQLLASGPHKEQSKRARKYQPQGKHIRKNATHSKSKTVRVHQKNPGHG